MNWICGLGDSGSGIASGSLCQAGWKLSCKLSGIVSGGWRLSGAVFMKLCREGTTIPMSFVGSAFVVIGQIWIAFCARAPRWYFTC